jgi:UDP-N-acetylmuramoyl-tripeptide--D-alanyl-D-alanine ligase
MRLLLFTLIVLAALSPLLTFARLFQMKEWRWDRLREHLRREGWFSQLFGRVRLAVTVVGLIFSMLPPLALDEDTIPAEYVLYGTIGLLAWFTLFRFVIRRQERPVWTKKAMAVFGLGFVMLSGLSWSLIGSGRQALTFGHTYVLLVPLFSFLFIGLSWLLLYPLDCFLKRRILRKAAALRLRYKHLSVIGITGSVGKTTTKELLAHILNDRKILVTPAHVNTEMGVANVMRTSLNEEHQIFIVEMGAYRRGEIKLLCSLVKPYIGIITFIGRQHLGLFGSQEELCRAKGELFASLPAGGHALLNADSAFCDDLMKLAACPVQTVGTGGHATYEAFDIQEGSLGVSFTLRGQSFTVPLRGTHQVTNVLLAIAAAEALGTPLSESSKRLQSFTPPAQTFEKKEGKSGQIVLDDTHNAGPESFRAAIEWTRQHGAQTKILVTSGLLELGKEEAAIHEELGNLSLGVFDEVVFLNKKCVRSFEQGYGKTVKVARRKKFKMKPGKELLIVCVGRMPEGIVKRLLL